MKLHVSRTNSCPPDKMSAGWKIELREGRHSLSRLWIVDRMMRVGGAKLKVGGISTVGTEVNYRGQGMAARVMRAALEFMEQKRYDASILHGIPNFYHRFGYVCCMPEHELRLSTPSLRDFGRTAPTDLDFQLRPFRQKDIPKLVRLHNRENAVRTGSVVRNASTWKGFTRGAGFFMKPGIRVVVDKRDAVRGYVVFDADKGSCKASEIGGNDGKVQAAILGFLSRRAAALGKKEILLALPPDHAFALFCRKFGCESRIFYRSDGGFMGRIINFRACMEKIAAEMRNVIPRGIVLSDIKLGSGVLFQLLMGYRSASDLPAEEKPGIRPAQIALLDRLFPLRNAHLAWSDRF